MYYKCWQNRRTIWWRVSIKHLWLVVEQYNRRNTLHDICSKLMLYFQTLIFSTWIINLVKIDCYLTFPPIKMCWFAHTVKPCLNQTINKSELCIYNVYSEHINWSQGGSVQTDFTIYIVSHIWMRALWPWILISKSYNWFPYFLAKIYLFVYLLLISSYFF